MKSYAGFYAKALIEYLTELRRIVMGMRYRKGFASRSRVTGRIYGNMPGCLKLAAECVEIFLLMKGKRAVLERGVEPENSGDIRRACFEAVRKFPGHGIFGGTASRASKNKRFQARGIPRA